MDSMVFRAVPDGYVEVMPGLDLNPGVVTLERGLGRAHLKAGDLSGPVVKSYFRHRT